MIPRVVVGALLIVNAMVGFHVALVGRASVLPIEAGDLFLLIMLFVQIAGGLTILRPIASPAKTRWDRIALGSELLFFLALTLFLFAYVYAINANMDYVQRFVASGGNVQLAPDTSQERFVALQRYAPTIILALCVYLYASARARRNNTGIFLVLISVVLSVASFPSFFAVQGWGVIGWFMLVPLFVALRRARPSQRVWFLLLYGVLFTLVGNYWLGTFNLVSLQTVGIVFFGYYLLFGIAAAGLLTVVQRGQWIALPLAWAVFELARSSGFLGYPWLLIGHTQYRFSAIVQYASVGGVWMVSFLVLLVNSLLAEAIIGPRRLRTVGATVVGFFLAAGCGAFLLTPRLPGDDTVRVALIQQSTDPRKNDYEETFAILRRLTDESLRDNPDLVVWSETAFVPNIRRWSTENPERYRLARLTREFVAYQRSIQTWLLTGNDDYRRVLDEDGNEIDRLNYNAAVLFDPNGRRVDTYHKIKLVPFTEHFPYKESFPRTYALLEDFDVAFWEPGSERTVFDHPKFRFATPICFEDVFPNEVRQFALAGADVIVNISNDYWSLTEVAATQHFVAGLFRAVELRIPVVRATASGVTAYVDPIGNIIENAPQYSEEYLVVDVKLQKSTSLYTKWGDWFPRFAAAAVVALMLANVYSWARRKRDG